MNPSLPKPLPPVSTLLLALFIVLIPFEYQFEGIRRLALWLSVLALAWEMRTEMSTTLGGNLRRLGGWFAGSIALAAALAGLTLVLQSREITDRVLDPAYALRRLWPFMVTVPLLVQMVLTTTRAGEPRMPRGERWAWTLIALWCGWMLLACLFSRSPYWSFTYLFREGGAYAVAFTMICLKCRRSRDGAVGWGTLMVATGGIIALVAIVLLVVGYLGPESLVQRMIAGGILRQNVSPLGYDILRVQYPFHWHSRLATYLLCTFLLAQALWPLARSRALRGLLLAVSLLTVLGIVLSGTRGAIVAAGFAVIVLILSRPRLLLGLVPILLLVVVALPGAFRSHLASIVRFDTYLNQASAFQMRVVGWKNTCEIIGDRPLIGQGYSWMVFSLIYPEFNLDGEDTEAKPHAHNNVLQIMAETGLVGLVIFMAFQALMLFKAGRMWWLTPAGRKRALALALLVLLLALQVYGITNYFLRRNAGFAVWAVWGFAWAMIGRYLHDPETPPGEPLPEPGPNPPKGEPNAS